MNIRESMNIVNESTGQECEMVEVGPGVWYYFLEEQIYDDPEERWGDWRDTARAYGPFNTYEEACEHLRANHANPGGHNVIEYRGEEPDEDTKRLMAQAVEDMKNTRTASRESPYRNFNRWG